MSSAHTQKRKRPTAKPVSKSKRLKRAAAYHSSSSEDEDEVDLVVNVNEIDEVETDEPRASSSVKEDVDDGKEVSASSARGLQGEALGPAKTLINGKAKSETGTTFVPVQSRTVYGAKDDPAESDGDSNDQDNSHDDDDETSSSSSLSSSTHPTSTTTPKPTKSNRHSPAHFAASLSTILSSKLTTSQRADPLLSRSVDAAATARAKNDSLLEIAARRKMRADKAAGKEKGRVRDVLGTGTGNDTGVGAEMDSKERALSAGKSTGQDEESVQETERRLKRTAQRGVVKLFNAVRAAQVGAAEAGEMSRREGTVGVERRKERVDEMSRKGFLEMLSGGG